MKPEVGHYLYATCAGEDYGRIIALGVDANGTPVMSIEVYNPDDLIIISDNDDSAFSEPNLSSFKLPEGTTMTIHDVQWKQNYPDIPDHIECRTPGQGCYRCTKSFLLRTTRSEWGKPQETQ